jgi:hypothetical protein
MAWHLLVAPAFAAVVPDFVADEPDDAALLRRAWPAGVACAAGTPITHPQIRVVREPEVDGYDGRAYLDDGGLYRIEVGGPDPRRQLLHELAHAWAARGPSTLTEGRADWLADCMALRLGDFDLLDPDDGRDLTDLPDLRRWANPRTRHEASDLDDDRADAYLGASRLMRVVTLLVPPERLFPTDGSLRWRDLEEHLALSGPSGEIVLDILEGGEERQRAVLTDHDRDGQPWLAEVLGGTDPDRWDSDDDGWWDGAPPHPEGAIVLPPDGSAVCAGVAASSTGAAVHVRSRVTRSTGQARVRLLAGDTWVLEDPSRGVSVSPSEAVLVALDGGMRGASGGAWALIGGQGLVSGWNCRSTVRSTLWVDDPTAADLRDRFEAELEVHLMRAEQSLGPAHRRLVVGLGTGSLEVTDDAVQLSTGLVAWARQTHRLDALAGLAVALHRVRHAPVPDERTWENAEALTRAIVLNPPDTLFVAVDQAWAMERGERARSCEAGWQGLLRGACP